MSAGEDEPRKRCPSVFVRGCGVGGRRESGGGLRGGGSPQPQYGGSASSGTSGLPTRKHCEISFLPGVLAMSKRDETAR